MARLTVRPEPRPSRAVARKPLQPVVAHFNHVGFFSELLSSLDRNEAVLDGIESRLQERAISAPRFAPFHPYRALPDPDLERQRQADIVRAMQLAVEASCKGEPMGALADPKDVVNGAAAQSAPGDPESATAAAADAAAAAAASAPGGAWTIPEPAYFAVDADAPVGARTAGASAEVEAGGGLAAGGRHGLQQLRARTSLALHQAIGPTMTISGDFLLAPRRAAAAEARAAEERASSHASASAATAAATPSPRRIVAQLAPVSPPPLRSGMSSKAGPGPRATGPAVPRPVRGRVAAAAAAAAMNAAPSSTAAAPAARQLWRSEQARAAEVGAGAGKATLSRLPAGS